MAKNTFYFSHDGNARNDEKLLAVRMRLGAEGYAIYFMILEKLLESTNYMSIKDYNILAFDFRVGADKVKTVVEEFGLFEFTEDKKHFYSPSFINRMKPLDNMREQRRVAGLKSAEKRAKSTKVEQNSTVVERVLGQNSTKESKVNNNILLEKESKGGDLKSSSDPSLSINFEKREKEKSCAKKEKELEPFKNMLMDLGADKNDVNEWFKIRIDNRKQTTRYFVEKFILECKKNKFSVQEAVYACAFNGWINFNYDWIINSKQKSNAKSQPTSDNPNDPKIGRAHMSDYEKLYQQMAGN